MIYNKGVIFDGDDTLWSTQPIYDTAKRSFYQVMAQNGFHQPETQRRLQQVDMAAVHEQGFSKNRFPASLLKTYRELSSENGIKVRPEVEQTVSKIGHEVFIKLPSIVPAARQVLTELSHQYRLILATKGDYAVQWEKLQHSGLHAFFRGIYIPEEKTDREFSDIVARERLAPHLSWSVGNSVRADINPAIRDGLNTIWIDQKTWEFENEEPIESHRLKKVNSLEDVLPILSTHQ